MSPTIASGDLIAETLTVLEAIPTPDRQWPRWAASDSASGAEVMVTLINRNEHLEDQCRSISARLKMLSHPAINPHLDLRVDDDHLYIIDARPRGASLAKADASLLKHPTLTHSLLEVLEFSETLGFAISDFDSDWVWVNQSGDPMLLRAGWPRAAVTQDLDYSEPALEGSSGFGRWLYRSITGQTLQDTTVVPDHPALSPESKRLVELALLTANGPFSALTASYAQEESLTAASADVTSLEAQPFARHTPQPTIENATATAASKPESVPQRNALTLMIVGLLVIVAGFVFFVLPSLVSTPKLELATENPIIDAPAEAKQAPSPLTAAKDKLAREKALTLAETLLRKIIALEDLGMKLWDPEQLTQINQDAVSADDAYRGASHQQSVIAYERLIQQVAGIEETLPKLRDRFQTQADTALIDANEEDSLKYWKILAALSPEDPDIQQRWQRVQSLPQIRALMAEAALLEQADEPRAAIKLLTDAMQLFPAWTPPKLKRAEIQQTLTEQAFRGSMSAGFAHLNGGDFELARQAFETAAELAPDQSSPREGLEQVRQARLNDQTNRLSDDARAAESSGQWALALAAYTEILSLNPALTTLQDRIKSIEHRIELSDLIDTLLADPSQLQSDQRLEEAKALVITINRLPAPTGDLKNKLGPLSRSIITARRPLALNLTSDNLTAVTVLKVGPEGSLGTFSQTALSLIPGRYVVTGSRQGYVDVRHNIELTADEPKVDLRVACEEKIL